MYFTVSFHIYSVLTSTAPSIEFKPLSSCLVTVDAMVLFLSLVKTQLSTTGTNVNNLHVWHFQLLQSWHFHSMWGMGLLKSRCSHPLTSATTSGTTLGLRGTRERHLFKWISSHQGRSPLRLMGMSSCSSTVSSLWVSPAFREFVFHCMM